MDPTLKLLYPQARHIRVSQVLSWGFDAKVNAAVDEHVKVHGVFDDEANPGAYEAFVASIAAPDLEESIELLEDLGHATFARRDR